MHRLEEVLAKCKITIQNGIETTTALTMEKETLQRELDKVTGGTANSGNVLVDVSTDNTAPLQYRIDELEVELEGLRSTLSTRDTDLTNARAETQTARAETQTARAETQTRSEEVCQLVSEVEKYKREVTGLTSEMDLVRQQLVETQERERDAVTREGEERKRREEGDKMVGELEVFKGRFEEAEKERERLATVLCDRRVNKVKNPNAGEDRSENKTDHLHYMFPSPITLHLTPPPDQAMEVQDLKREHSEQVQLLNSKISSLKQDLDNSHRNLDLLKDSENSLQDLLEEMSGLRSELERLATENTSLCETISGLEERVEEGRGCAAKGDEEKRKVISEERRSKIPFPKSCPDGNEGIIEE
eukprot:sb/3479722/